MKKVRQRIKAYTYRRRDGKVVDVKSHIRTYWKKATSNKKEKVKKSAKRLGRIAIVTSPVWMTHLHRTPPMTYDELKTLKKAMNIPEDARIAIRKDPIIAIAGGRGAAARLFPREREYHIYVASESLRKPALMAHELGHIATWERLGDDNGRIRRVAKLGVTFPGRAIYMFGIPIVTEYMGKGKKRTALISAMSAPIILSEAYASYLGYKGLKRTKGKVTPFDKFVLISSPVTYGLHSYTLAKYEKKKRK